MGGFVEAVEDGSIAAELGLCPGDEVVAIDGHALRDLIDYRFRSAEPEIELLVRRPSGDVVFEIEKDWSEDLGLRFACPVFDGVRECNNRCAFCFVDQAAPGMRDSTLIHDDDYRLSFLAGNFVTLTNLTEDDLVRIAEWRLSPLHVSVHATDPEARARLFRSPHHDAGLRNLRRLADAGIDFHCQVVLCPAINDRATLEGTVRDLAALHPRILSVGVVPVGLTAFREGLVPLRPVGPREARDALELIDRLQSEFHPVLRTRFVFAADELYLQAGRELPSLEEYEELPQIENGVGLCRSFFDELSSVLGRLGAVQGPFAVVTGVAAAPLFREALSALPPGTVEVVAVENRYLGPSVTVAGLIPGQDLLASLEATGWDRRPGAILVPAVALNDDGLFIDSVSLAHIRARTVACIRVTTTPEDVGSALRARPEGA